MENKSICNYFLTGKVSILNKLNGSNVFQETAEVFENETVNVDEITEAGLRLVLQR